MKKILRQLITMCLLVIFVYSCNEPLYIEEPGNDTELKSANRAKQSYIVLINDADLDMELLKLKGYEKKRNTVKSASAKIIKRTGVTDGEIEHVYGSAVKGFSVKIPPGQLKKLENDPSVLLVEQDQVLSLIHPLKKPDRPGKPGGGGEDPPTGSDQETPWGITRVNGGVDGSGKTAWVIDSGIDMDHPDLNVDNARSQSFLSGKQSTNLDDQNGHGTHVAGTIAAIDNNFGVIGVAAGAQVVSVRVLDRRGNGSTSGVIAGVDYVAANASGNDVANMSLGGGVSTALDNAVKNASASCVFVLAAGNESDDANNHSPARVNGNNIYTISASDINDNWAYFSNYGNPPVDYCAPGYNIKSCYKGGNYSTLSGTSMAAPHVAGIVLLGNIGNGGTVNGDPDGDSDIIAVH